MANMVFCKKNGKELAKITGDFVEQDDKED